jgi:hypothetical protein
VATDARFQTYLDTAVGMLSSRSLQGLVWCCHMCWSPAFATGAVVQRVHQRLVTYQGTDAMLTHWRQYADVLLGPAGPRSLAAALIAARGPIATFCHTWAIDERSPYVLATLQHALPLCMQEMVEEPALRAYLLTVLLPWSGWTTKDFYTAIGATVLHPVTTATPRMPEQLTTLVLADARLGDPRLPSQSQHWRELPQAARQQCVHWLSQADIAFFFDHVLPESKDRDERKAFWLLYAPRVLRSRPLLHEADRLHLQPLMRQMPEFLVHFGFMGGETSALILDFGAVVVVQVSDLHAACYVYGKRDFAQLVPDFWQSRPFTVDTLLVSTQAATIYHQQAWEKKLAEILALCDIHPTYKAPA